jgi:hypothetical protein
LLGKSGTRASNREEKYNYKGRRLCLVIPMDRGPLSIQPHYGRSCSGITPVSAAPSIGERGQWGGINSRVFLVASVAQRLQTSKGRSINFA